MADTSMSEVTITLGCLGQVVKRGNPFDQFPAVGSKRSVRNRLGNSVDESILSKHDLRFKILKKAHSNNRMHQSLPNPSNGRPRDDRNRMPEQRDDEIEVEKHILKLNDDRQHIQDPIRAISIRTSEALSRWTFNHIMHRSPPPPPLPIRAYNDPIPMPLPYASQNVSDIARPLMTSSFHINPPLVNFQLPIGDIVQQAHYPVEHVTLEGFLHSLGLHKYVISFRVEEVDMATLSQMGEHDLRELGIPMGPRKKILLALLARTRRQTR